MPSDLEEPRPRSASPPRQQKKTTSKGFKWKEKRPRDEDSSGANEGRLERGYRDRSPRRDNYRDRSPRRDRDQYRRDDRNETSRFRDRSPRRKDDRSNGDSYRPNRDAEGPQPEQKEKPQKDKKDRKDKKDKKPKPDTSEPMIVVNVNDRLGTKAGIPCLASDSVKAFKAMVAAHIGRQPHEIMLKRQGERPFKDQLSLADYGVSNGVQLDLELDTGD